MASTYLQETGGSGKTDFDFLFPVIQTEDIVVALDGVIQTSGYTPTLTSVKFNTAPDGKQVRIYRKTTVGKTNGQEDPKAVFASGSSIRATDLNNNQEQVLYGIHELQEQKEWFNEITLPDDAKIKLGNSAGDAEIYYKDNNFLQIESNGSIVLDTDAGNFVVSDGGVAKFGWSSNSALGVYVVDHIRPFADNTYDLGSSSLQWKDIYIDGTAHLDTVDIDAGAIDGTTIGANSAAAGTFTSVDLQDSQKIKLGSSDDAEIYYDGTFLNLTSADEIKIDATDNVQIVAAGSQEFKIGSTIRFWINNSIDSLVAGWPLVPGVDDTYDLGSSSLKWKDIYIDGTAYLDNADISSITGSAIVTSGTSTSDNKVYSAKRCDELYYNIGTAEEIQSGETWAAADNKIATTAAIDARIVDLVDDVGGFVPIANELSFPNDNPDFKDGAGTLVSINSTVNSITTAGDGSVGIQNGTVGGSVVTITGLPASTEYAAGTSMLVESTSTLHTYTFHRFVPNATEVTAVAGKIAELGRLGTADAVADMNTLGTAAIVEDMNLLGTASCVADMALLADSAVIADMAVIADTSNLVTNIGSVADIQANVTTVAGVSSNVTTVAGIASNVTTVANNNANVSAVAGKATEIGILGTADAVADMNTLGTTAIVSDLDTLADISSNITTVAGVSANVTTVAGNNSNVTTVAGISSDVTSVAGKATEIGLLGTSAVITDLSILGTADVVADLNTLGTADVVSDMNALAVTTVLNDMDTLATTSNVSNMSTCAGSITNINNAPTHATNAAASATSAEAHKVAAAGIYTQVQSAPYNINANADFGLITDTGGGAVFTSETANTLLTMSEGSSTYNYAGIT